MPQTFLVFDFGTSEEAAQQARHQLEAWRQAFRLGDRVQFKFERKPAEEPAAAPGAAAESPKKKSKNKTDAPAAEAAPVPAADRLRLLVCLEFSEHEKLSYQRWLDRIPAEAPFESAQTQIVRRGQEGFAEANALFDELA